MPGDLARDELKPTTGRVGDHQAPDARAEDAALGLDVERPLVVGHVRASHAANLGGVLAQVLALGADPHSRREVELVVRRRAALLRIHGGRLPVHVVHPAEPLGKHGAVRLDRCSISSLQPVARVVALEECLLHLGRRVEDQRRNLLEGCRRVQLLAQPARGMSVASEVDVLNARIHAPARYL